MGNYFEINWVQLLLPRLPLAGVLLAGVVISLTLCVLHFIPRRQEGPSRDNEPRRDLRHRDAEELWENGQVWKDGASNAIEAREAAASSPKAECEDRELAALRAVAELRSRLRWHRQQVARIEEALRRYDE